MRIRIPSSWRKLTNGAAAVEESAATVAELIDRLDVRFPGLAGKMCEPDGQLKRFINVFVSGKDIRNLQGVQTPLQDGDEVVIAPAMARG